MGAALIELGDAPAAWERVGFAPDAAGEVVLGDARLRLTGRGGGILRIQSPDLTSPNPDGLPLQPSSRGLVPGRGLHPNGASVVDHVVALTGSLGRTVAALTGAGLELRRSTATMAFLRLGPTILEVVERGEDPPRLWGLVVVVPALEGLGPVVSAPKDAVQPGRRIATVSREAGLGTALALMTPRRT
ncbi:MAG: hypothetical protein ABI611_11680 [Solirubrobacteraceae bacterium]